MRNSAMISVRNKLHKSFSHTSFEWEQEQELMNPELSLAKLTGKVVPVT